MGFFILYLAMHFKPPFLITEFVFKTSRSGGKGGQNVNKVSSKVLIEFSVRTSQLITEKEKEILLEKLANKLTKEDVLQIVSQTERSQLENKEIALRKMYAALNRCFVVKKKRTPTKPSRSSVEKRLNSKKRTAEVKRLRKVEEE
jgi:ribosome-associated protein